MIKKAFDLIEFEKFSIRKSKKFEGVIFYEGRIKNIRVWTWTEHEEPMTRPHAVKKAKKTFYADLMNGEILKMCAEEHVEYFTNLRNDIQNLISKYE